TRPGPSLCNLLVKLGVFIIGLFKRGKPSAEINPAAKLSLSHSIIATLVKLSLTIIIAHQHLPSSTFRPSENATSDHHHHIPVIVHRPLCCVPSSTRTQALHHRCTSPSPLTINRDS
ncbi:Unknown protein, partial [Striga hermonthica]